MFNFIIRVYEGATAWQDEVDEGNYNLPEPKTAVVRINSLDDIQTVGLHRMLNAEQFNVLNHALARFSSMDELQEFAARYPLNMDVLTMVAGAEDIHDEQFLMEVAYSQHYRNWLESKLRSLQMQPCIHQDAAYKQYIRENIYPLIPGCGIDAKADSELSILISALANQDEMKRIRTSEESKLFFSEFVNMFGTGFVYETFNISEDDVDLDVEKFSKGILPAMEAFFGVKASEMDFGKHRQMMSRNGTRWHAQGREMVAALLDGKSLHPIHCFDKAAAILRIMGAFSQYKKWIDKIPVVLPEGLEDQISAVSKEVALLRPAIEDSDLVVIQEEGFTLMPIPMGDSFMVEV